MTSSDLPETFDVWLFAFEYDDQPGVAKQRPVAIGAVDELRGMVLAVKVTSHAPRAGSPGEVPILDWAQAGLAKPSVARCSQTLLVPIEAFEGLRRFGTLSARDAQAILGTLEALGKVV